MSLDAALEKCTECVALKTIVYIFTYVFRRTNAISNYTQPIDIHIINYFEFPITFTGRASNYLRYNDEVNGSIVGIYR